MEHEPIKIRLCLSCLILSLSILPFALLSLYFALDVDHKKWTLIQGIVGVFGFLSLSGLSFPILLRTIFRYPVIIADEMGIKFTSAFSKGFMPWNEVKRIRTADYGKPKYVVITPTNTERYIRTQSIFNRALLRYIAKQKFPVCMILVDCKEISEVHHEVAESLNHLKDSLSKIKETDLKIEQNLMHQSNAKPK